MVECTRGRDVVVPSDYISSCAAATFAGVSRTRINQLVWQGKLGHFIVREGGRRRGVFVKFLAVQDYTRWRQSRVIRVVPDPPLLPEEELERRWRDRIIMERK